MTTKNKKPIKLAIKRTDDVGEHGYPKLLVGTPYGALELRLYSKTRACIQTGYGEDRNKVPLTINQVDYDGSGVFTNGQDEQDYYDTHAEKRRLPDDAGEWAFRYRSGHFNISRTDWLSNPSTKYNMISEGARRKIYDLIPLIMAAALEQVPTLLEEAELAQAKDLEARAVLEVGQKHREWKTASKERQAASRKVAQTERALAKAKAKSQSLPHQRTRNLNTEES